MLGILFFVFVGVCGVIFEIIKAYQNYVVRKDLTEEEKEKEKEQGYYHSMWGGNREVGTGRQVIVLTDEKTGDECMYAPGTTIKVGKLIKNISAEKRQKRIDEEIKNGKASVYWYDLPETHLPDSYTYFNDNLKDIKGTRYKDRETGHVYVVRCLDTKTKFGKCNFFMDITNGNEGHLVRLCDNEFQPNMYYPNAPYPNLDDEEGMSIIQAFIDKFNTNQDKDFANKDDYFFISHYYCNKNEGTSPYKEEHKHTKWAN